MIRFRTDNVQWAVPPRAQPKQDVDRRVWGTWRARNGVDKRRVQRRPNQSSDGEHRGSCLSVLEGSLLLHRLVALRLLGSGCGAVFSCWSAAPLGGATFSRAAEAGVSSKAERPFLRVGLCLCPPLSVTTTTAYLVDPFCTHVVIRFTAGGRRRGLAEEQMLSYRTCAFAISFGLSEPLRNPRMAFLASETGTCVAREPVPRPAGSEPRLARRDTPQQKSAD